MKRSVYIALFVVVLLAAGIGGFLGARALLNQLQQDFGPREGWTPVPTTPIEVSEADTAAAEVAASPTPEPRRATATMLVVPAPATGLPPLDAASPEPTWTAGVDLPIAEFMPLETPLDVTPEPSATPNLVFPFVLARAVRYSNGDCPGTYALGTVTDRAGNPLAGVRLYLVDEYGNEATAVTKPGPGDTGRYDFPMGGPPRRFSMTVVDEAGNPLSAGVEILHELPPQEGQNCRWVDWRRR